MKVLTKSLFILGRQGDKYLWICANKPELLPKHTLFEENNINTGQLIGELAKKLFEEGVDLKDLTEDEAVKKTEDLMHDKTLFEASFKQDNYFCKVDVLKPTSKGFDVFEVKSSSNSKPKHTQDLAFQRMVLEKAGLKVNSYNLILINGDYTLQEEFVLKEFFKIEDVTAKVENTEVESEAKRLLSVINKLKQPEFEVDCIVESDNGNFLIDEFKKNEGVGSVFDLYSISRKKALSFYKQGFQLMYDLPKAVELTEKQLIQINASNQVHVDKKKVSEFISKLEKPIIHLDFEAYQQVIPTIKCTSAYQQIPFQYSMHIEEEKLVHKEFLYEKEDDPRWHFIERLKKDLPSKGSILVYYKPFEVGRLKDLAKSYPKYEEFVKEVISRIVDLRDPFFHFWFYDSRQRGSCSIKDVLPIFSEMNHKDLNLSSGSDAMILYKTHKGKLTTNLKEDLLEYCKLDTLAMVIILEGLRKSFYT